MLDDIQEGTPVIWLRTFRGGYGYVARILVTFLARRSDRVKIRVYRRDGTSVIRWVHCNHVRMLSPAEEERYCEIIKRQTVPS